MTTAPHPSRNPHLLLLLLPAFDIRSIGVPLLRFGVHNVLFLSLLAFLLSLR